MKTSFILIICTLFSCIKNEENKSNIQGNQYVLNGQIKRYLINRINTIDLNKDQKIGVLFNNLDFEKNEFVLSVLTPSNDTKTSYLLNVSNNKILLTKDMDVPVITEWDEFYKNIPDDVRLEYTRNPQNAEMIYFNFGGDILKIISPDGTNITEKAIKEVLLNN